MENSCFSIKMIKFQINYQNISIFMIEETIEIEPATLELALDQTEQLTLQNTSLHYIAVYIIAPQFFQVSPQLSKAFCIGFIDPCSSLKVAVKFQAGCYYQKSTNRITILTHDIEELEVDWSTIELQKHYVPIQCSFSQQLFKMKSFENYDFVLIVQKVPIVKSMILTEDEKALILHYCFKKFGNTQNYKISPTIIILTYSHTNAVVENMVNEVEVLAKNFVFQVSKPSPLLCGLQKYQSELASPQLKKTKKAIQEEMKEQIQQPTLTSKQEQYVQQLTQQIPIAPPPPKNPKAPSTGQKGKSTPVVVEESKSDFTSTIESKQISKNLLVEVGCFNTYQNKVSHILLFRDNSYLVAADQKNCIRIWNVNSKSEVGILRELEEYLNFEIVKLAEWRLPCEGKRFFILSNENNFKVYNVERVQLEITIYIPDLVHLRQSRLIDRDLLCICGTPEKKLTRFGHRLPKFRYLKFFSEFYEETQSFKINCKEEQNYITHIVYTENDETRKHSRLNNILLLSLGQPGGQGGEILVIFVDMLQQCTAQIGVREINAIEYLGASSKFGLVCDLNKVLLLNLKQMQTDKGLQNGLECKYFEDVQSESELLLLAEKELILRMEGSKLEVTDMKSGQKAEIVVLQGKSSFHEVQAGRIIRVDDECILIFDLQL